MRKKLSKQKNQIGDGSVRAKTRISGVPTEYMKAAGMTILMEKGSTER